MNARVWTMVAWTVAALAIASLIAERTGWRGDDRATTGSGVRAPAGVVAEGSAASLATSAGATAISVATATASTLTTIAGAAARSTVASASAARDAGPIVPVATLVGVAIGFHAGRRGSTTPSRRRRGQALGLMRAGTPVAGVARATQLPQDALRMVVRSSERSGLRRQSLPAGSKHRRAPRVRSAPSAHAGRE